MAKIIEAARMDLNNTLKVDDEDDDYMVWCPDHNGTFSVNSTFNEVRGRSNEVEWCSFIWSSVIHPKVSASVLKLIRNGLATEARAQSIGVSLASCCRACYNGEDYVTYILWKCSFAQVIWQWPRQKFKCTKSTGNLKQAMRVEKDWSPLIKQMWTSTVVGGMMALWQQRNSMTLLIHKLLTVINL
ncbi:hypothetical protein FRX31_007668 [Thalictrum thalictroides]|uniref:Reverse transcriptase zinc-binding domain-containing protein n=1 Tax=Thalictrum thalictroides TaxID=46969 RepID=A0A7J6WZ52_THATH|nr:hypothetical protein FRX31_007668 [Thalictrum thalictroides]